MFADAVALSAAGSLDTNVVLARRIGTPVIDGDWALGDNTGRIGIPTSGVPAKQKTLGDFDRVAFFFSASRRGTLVTTTQ